MGAVGFDGGKKSYWSTDPLCGARIASVMTRARCLFLLRNLHIDCDGQGPVDDPFRKTRWMFELFTNIFAHGRDHRPVLFAHQCLEGA